MAFKLPSRVKQTSVTTGIGAYSLVAPGTNARAFSAAYSTGDKLWYCCSDGSNVEIGRGTLTTGAPDTISRDTIIFSSNSNAAVNWAAGTRDIYPIIFPGTYPPTTTAVGVTISEADCGNVFIYNPAVNITQNLPAVAGMPLGMTMEFVNAGSAGAVVSLAPNGADLINGANTAYSLPIGVSVKFLRESTGWRTLFANVQGVATSSGLTLTSGLLSLDAGTLRGHIAGLLLSNNSGAPLTKVDISIGACADGGNTAFLKSSGVLTLDCGTNGANGLEGAQVLAANKWVHVWLIAKADGSVAAFGNRDDTTGLSPTLPATYTLKRRLGSVLTNGSSQILAFFQRGDFITFSTPVFDLNNVSPGDTLAHLRTMSTPPSVNTLWHGNVSVDASTDVYISSPDAVDVAASLGSGVGGVANPIGSLGGQTAAGSQSSVGQVECWTDTASQIRLRQTSSVAVSISTLGWMDYRGRMT